MTRLSTNADTRLSTAAGLSRTRGLARYVCISVNACTCTDRSVTRLYHDVKLLDMLAIRSDVWSFEAGEICVHQCKCMYTNRCERHTSMS